MFDKRWLAGLAFVAVAGCDNSSPSPVGEGATTGTADVRTPSVARLWNDALLDDIRRDFARPTVHARNLFHVSAAMYDAWAAYDGTASPYLLGRTHGNFSCGLGALPAPDDVQVAREEAISHAAYQMILHRFTGSPRRDAIRVDAEDLMFELGYDPDDASVDYSTGSAAAAQLHRVHPRAQLGRQIVFPVVQRPPHHFARPRHGSRRRCSRLRTTMATALSSSITTSSTTIPAAAVTA
jgi:hypothetical protein